MRAVRNYVGHARDVTAIAWHPHHNRMFASGGFDGSLKFWMLDEEKPLADVPEAHEGSIQALAWHPIGHILSSGSHDQTVRFWCETILFC